jgi:hypothetical protein
MIDLQTLLAELVHCPWVVTKDGHFFLYKGKWTSIDELKQSAAPA